MGMHTTSMPYRAESVEFFLQHAGWSWQPQTETEDEGHGRSARELAQAELWANTAGALVFEWEDDPDYDGDDGPAYGCLARRQGQRDVLASLWDITFTNDSPVPGRDPYCRVVEAELALDILADTRENDLLLMANPELRALVAYAS